MEGLLVQHAEYPETIYSRNTRSELIVKFAQDVDITPLLGSHHWPRFHRRLGAKQVISYIFEYKYVANGDPENHNWAINELDACDPPHWEGYVPFKQPYPAPEWANVREPMLACKDLALPIPVPDEEPFPPPEEAQPKPKPDSRLPERLDIDESSVYSFVNAMQERRPKTEENADSLHPQSRDVTAAAQRASQSSNPPIPGRSVDPRQKSSTVPSRLGDKADPYEEEIAAAQLLKAEPEHDNTLLLQGTNVKNESQGPGPDLLAAFDDLQRSRGETARSSSSVKSEARDDGPSVELEAAMRDYTRSRQQSTTSVKPEPSDGAHSVAISSRRSIGHSSRERSTSQNLSSNAANLPPRPLASEPSYNRHSGNPRPGMPDPRRRDMPVKRERESEWDTDAKRQRRDSYSSRR
ncbi:hypothetical protein PHLGIDRAFT_342547 [Phlebiopsis gigantea 11061_1 CR5-6]|uniref:Uncharacterized protein n=1 Tax=Phlebiopsis gigantea (strain 11061_1 CR5-6) TaxID=745531 RepID=A0A0C3SCW2_PHLG1|nr:hypothetical protein PHLGIDRAFT_342547 [Phlebiopsis gigantea 11061_1 CR5-6]